MQRDERILLAARELFHERGFEAVGVDDIGARAGTTGPAIYRHFASKQELLGTLFDRALDALLEQVGMPSFTDPWDEIEHLVRAQATFVVENPELAALYMREDRSLDEPRRRQWLRRRSAYVERWVDCLARCLPDRSAEDLTSTAWAAISLVIAVGTWPAEARRSEDLVDLLVTVTVGGFAALQPAGQIRRVA